MSLVGNFYEGETVWYERSSINKTMKRDWMGNYRS